MNAVNNILVDLADLGLDLTNHTALLMLPLIQVAWADGKVDRGERFAIRAFAVNNRLVDEPGLAMVEHWMNERPSDAYIHRGMELLVRLGWERQPFSAGLSIDRIEQAVDYCEVVGRTTKNVLTGNIPRADREAIEAVEVEVARLHATHGPQDGAVGYPITEDWIELLEDLRAATTHDRLRAS